MAPRREDDGCPIGSDVRSASEIPEVSVVSSSTFLNAAGSRSPRLMISYTSKLQSNLAFDFGVQAERTWSRRLAASVHGQQRPETSVSRGVAVPAYCCEFPKRAETSAATHRSHVLAASSLFHSSHFICAHGRMVRSLFLLAAISALSRALSSHDHDLPRHPFSWPGRWREHSAYSSCYSVLL
jgi:hypothetical protein